MNTTEDTYLFICCNVRDTKKACGNHQDMDALYAYFKQTLREKRSEWKEGRIVKVNKSGCLGRCAEGPNIVIFPDNVWYTYQTKDDINEIIEEHIIHGRKVERLLIRQENNGV